MSDFKKRFKQLLAVISTVVALGGGFTLKTAQAQTQEPRGAQKYYGEEDLLKLKLSLTYVINHWQ